MEGIKIAVLTFILWGLQFGTVQNQKCEIRNDVSGMVVVWRFAGYTDKQKCWTIPVETGHFVNLQFKMSSFHPCSDENVRISIAGSKDVYHFCHHKDISNITAFNNVTMTHSILTDRWRLTTLTLKYTIRNMECLKTNSFQCDENMCISLEKVCDGVKDCKNKADETGCASKVLPIKGVSEARQKALSWLKQKRTAAWGWKENTPRAVTALYLASGATFNGTVLEEELMAKQAELKIAVSLLRPSLTNSELSMFINALLVTCHNPRQFYGNDLVKRLKEQVEESGNFTHPLAYLALCNANETWPLKANSDLNNILNSSSEYPFTKDLQAIALMAYSCDENRIRNIDSQLSNTTATFYSNTIRHFKKLQAEDGSFGNVYTTALITQALLSSGQEHSRDWKLNATIEYLMSELNSSSVDFLTSYLILPILNGKSLMDVSLVNCSANPRKHGDDPVSEIEDLHVQYSLFIGDEKEVVHTISLRVPVNFTASQVMKLTELGDPKYKFEWKMTSGKVYVYKIGNLANDPEAGKFWLLYMDSDNTSGTLTHLTNGPDEIVMADGDHLIMWYRTATV